ncbi:hypothetical protein V6N13_002726 [Hibiscus sabdariffa]
MWVCSSFSLIQTAWKVGKDGIEAGTNLVPDSVPRPIARISVTVVALAVALFVLRSFLSTAFFALVCCNFFLSMYAWREQASPCRQRKSTTCRATMGLVYFVLIALNKDQGPRGGSGSGSDSMEDPVEEARKIMEKYK